MRKARIVARNRLPVVVILGASSALWVIALSPMSSAAGERQAMPGCKSASAMLGTQPGMIRFIVHCRATSVGGFTTFNISRYGSRNQTYRGSGILKYTQRPMLSGSGDHARFGVCELSRAGLACRARARGRITFSGQMRVRRGAQCAKRVTIEVLLLPVCEHGDCGGSLKTRVLVDGRPRGC